MRIARLLNFSLSVFVGNAAHDFLSDVLMLTEFDSDGGWPPGQWKCHVYVLQETNTKDEEEEEEEEEMSKKTAEEPMIRSARA